MRTRSCQKQPRLCHEIPPSPASGGGISFYALFASVAALLLRLLFGPAERSNEGKQLGRPLVKLSYCVQLQLQNDRSFVTKLLSTRQDDRHCVLPCQLPEFPRK